MNRVCLMKSKKRYWRD